MTKKDELLNWMQFKKVFASHDVVKWSLDNFHLRADRDKRDFMKEGYIRKLSEFEKTMSGYTCKDAVYEWVGKNSLNKIIKNP